MKFVLPVIIIAVVIKYDHFSINPLFIPLIGVIMVAVFMKRSRIVKISQFETFQTKEEMLARNASAIESSTGIKPTTDLENSRNFWKGGSVHFFTMNEFEEEDEKGK